MDVEVSGRDEATPMRLLDRLPGVALYESESLECIGAPPVNRYVLGKTAL